jgi:hypothetical protein
MAVWRSTGDLGRRGIALNGLACVKGVTKLTRWFVGLKDVNVHILVGLAYTAQGGRRWRRCWLSRRRRLSACGLDRKIGGRSRVGIGAGTRARARGRIQYSSTTDTAPFGEWRDDVRVRARNSAVCKAWARIRSSTARAWRNWHKRIFVAMGRMFCHAGRGSRGHARH